MLNDTVLMSVILSAPLEHLPRLGSQVRGGLNEDGSLDRSKSMAQPAYALTSG